MARLKLTLAFFALMILSAGVAGAAYYWQKFVRPEQQVESKISGKSAEEKPDIGRKHYEKAVSYIEEGELLSARNELQYLLDVYPESPTMPEAKRVLGELNLDLMISKIPMEGKSEYKVKRGDAWSTIARNTGTTYDFIMRANGKSTTFIYPNEDLTVMKLTCEAEIDLKKRTLTIRDGEKFIKEYAILDKNLPSHFPSKVSTSISEKVAWYNGKSIDFENSNYLRSKKWIRTKKMGLFIRQMPDKDEVEEGATKPYGVMIAKSDLEELFTILRRGSPVRVVIGDD